MVRMETVENRPAIPVPALLVGLVIVAARQNRRRTSVFPIRQTPSRTVISGILVLTT